MGRNASSPWVGLRPYGEEDREYFRGRERDERIVASNLRARRLTVLYGSPGIGKSSLLLAGVVPTLREKRAALVFRDWQGPSFLQELKRSCVGLVRERGHELDAEQPLDELLAAAGQVLGRPMLVVFDQFEEYFVAHAPAGNGVGFEPEFARAVNRPDVNAGFLISLREDALAAMDRFQARIPNLLRNLIRLEYLTTDAAERVIQESLDAWNREHDAAAAIEPELLRELLPDVLRRTRAPLVGTLGGTEAPDDAIEAPFLQLVLERLWEAEGGEPSSQLTLGTYIRLGRAQGIVGSHFDAILASLTPKQRELCARFFDRIVTPSGGKVSYPVADLEKLAGELAPQIESTLETLENARILRRVDAGGRKTIEIYHDVLAPTIVRWSAEIARQQERRRLLRRVAQLVLAVLVVGAVGALIVMYLDWRSARPWARLSDLGSGKVFQLKGSQVVVGRRVPGQHTDVSFPMLEVSRLHLIVYRDGRALDVRSTNGTTVNGRFLAYGHGERKLLPGDVLVLAGIVVLRYERIHYAFWQVWPPSKTSLRGPAGWALLVTGRRVTPITSKKTYLSLVGGKIVSSGSSEAALAAVRPGNGVYELDEISDDRPTVAECGNANGKFYRRFRILEGQPYDVPGNCVLILRGHRAQVVPLPR